MPMLWKYYLPNLRELNYVVNLDISVAEDRTFLEKKKLNERDD